MRYDGSASEWEAQATSSPFRFALKFVLAATLIIGAMMAGCFALGVFGTTVGVVNEAASVVREEFGPRALLMKYEWFKDAAAALDKKQADISVYASRMTALSAAYDGVPRGQWPRDDREQLSIWQSEVAGVRASYNSLAAEYNAEMAKFNWRFTNVGDVPQGGKPLPREYRTYEEN